MTAAEFSQGLISHLEDLGYTVTLTSSFINPAQTYDVVDSQTQSVIKITVEVIKWLP